MIKLFLHGRATKDVELSSTNSNIPYCRFNLACKTEMQDKNGEYKTEFVTCIAWREKAELIAKSIKKGDQLIVLGALNSRQYENRDGIQTVWECTIKEISFVDKKGEPTNTEMKTPQGLSPYDGDDEDSLPF